MHIDDTYSNKYTHVYHFHAHCVYIYTQIITQHIYTIYQYVYILTTHTYIYI